MADLNENNLIRELRLRKNWTQRELASKSGVSVGTIAQLEAGKKTHPGSRRKVVEAMGYTFQDDRGWIFPGSGMVTLLIQANQDWVDRLKLANVDSMARLGTLVAEGLIRDVTVRRVDTLTEDNQSEKPVC